ncbi:MAG: hypothetical protein V8T17_06545, partial [Oscillospiraceae bacterium]
EGGFGWLHIRKHVPQKANFARIPSLRRLAMRHARRGAAACFLMRSRLTALLFFLWPQRGEKETT